MCFPHPFNLENEMSHTKNQLVHQYQGPDPQSKGEAREILALAVTFAHELIWLTFIEWDTNIPLSPVSQEIPKKLKGGIAGYTFLKSS